MLKKCYLIMCSLFVIFGVSHFSSVQAKEISMGEPLYQEIVQTDDPTDVSGLAMGAVVAVIGIVALVYYQVKGKHQK